MSRFVWIGPVLLLLLGLGLWRAPGEPTSPPLPADPRRIVSLAPSLTEIVVALGRGERLAGVTDYCEGVGDDVPRIGGLRFDLEALLALGPDLVVAIETRAQAGLRRALVARGIAVEVHPAETIGDVRAALAALGERLGAAERASEIVAGIDAALVPPEGEAVRGIFVVERTSLTVAGGGSFIDAMLRAAGIENVYGDAAWSYRRVELEALVARDPALILDASFDGAPSEEFWGRFPMLRAVREGGVRQFPPVRPGVRIPEWVDRLRAEAASVR